MDPPPEGDPHQHTTVLLDEEREIDMLEIVLTEWTEWTAQRGWTEVPLLAEIIHHRRGIMAEDHLLKVACPRVAVQVEIIHRPRGITLYPLGNIHHPPRPGTTLPEIVIAATTELPPPGTEPLHRHVTEPLPEIME